jgi:hypothetical protein
MIFFLVKRYCVKKSSRGVLGVKQKDSDFIVLPQEGRSITYIKFNCQLDCFFSE